MDEVQIPYEGLIVHEPLPSLDAGAPALKSAGPGPLCTKTLSAWRPCGRLSGDPGPCGSSGAGDMTWDNAERAGHLRLGDTGPGEAAAGSRAENAGPGCTQSFGYGSSIPEAAFRSEIHAMSLSPYGDGWPYGGGTSAFRASKELCSLSF